MKKITEEFILKKAATGHYFCMQKYNWSHDYIRKLCRRLKNKSKIEKALENNTQVFWKTK